MSRLFQFREFEPRGENIMSLIGAGDPARAQAIRASGEAQARAQQQGREAARQRT
jgi:hypothetical protein